MTSWLTSHDRSNVWSGTQGSTRMKGISMIRVLRESYLIPRTIILGYQPDPKHRQDQGPLLVLDNPLVFVSTLVIPRHQGRSNGAYCLSLP